MEDFIKLIKTNDEFKLISDPYRMKILDTMAVNDGPMTVKMIATELNEVPAKVHYHVKKLLAADILNLDHTEQINGITAKYYKVKYTHFQIDMDDAQTDKMKEIQVDNVTKLVLSKIDAFRDDFVQRAKDIKLQPDAYKNKEEDGFISKVDLYLTAEEMDEYRTEINNITKKYHKKDPNKKRYSTFVGIIAKK